MVKNSISMLNKKAQIDMTLWWLIEIFLMIILVFFVFNPAIDNQASDLKFYKRFSAKNLALYVDTVYASPYPLKVYYSENTPSFTYIFEEDRIYVLEEGERLTKSTYYSFIPDINKEFRGKTIEPEENIRIEDMQGNILSNIPIAFIATDERVYPSAVAKTSEVVK